MANKPTIITVANQKGGVGKTTAVANLAASLANRGHLILVIDCDYQANVTSLLCSDEQARHTEKSITYAIRHDLSVDKVIVGSQFKNIDLVPSNRELDDLREKLVGQPNQFRLVDLMLDCDKTREYDFILIDTHPSLDCFFQSAVAASGHFIVPLFPEADSSRGLAHQLQAIDKIKRYLNPRLNFLGCAIMKYDRYSATHQKFEKLIRQFCAKNGMVVFRSNIPNSQSVAAAAAHGLPLFYYRAELPAAKAYADMADEIIQLVKSSPVHNRKNNKKNNAELVHSLEIAADL